MDNDNIWKVINKYFEDNPQCLVRHHVESYNDFFKNGIFQIFKEKNPVELQTRYDEKLDDYRSKCIMYFGGKEGNKIYFGKPIIYDNNNSHYMFPNEARLRNMTYGITIHYDIEIDFIDILEDGEQPTIIGSEDMEVDDSEVTSVELRGGVPKRKKELKRINFQLTPAEIAELKNATNKSVSFNTQKRTITLDKIFLGKFPIMLQSDHCILSGLTRELKHTMGECLNDIGGYFIISGKEKTVVSQEKFGDNMLYIKKVTSDNYDEFDLDNNENIPEYLYSAEIRSVSENVSKPIRTLSVKIVTPTSSFTNKNIVVNIPNVRKPIPLFIVFRALGFISDKQIITMCLLDLDKNANLVDLFIPSVHDAGGILTQRLALKYIATLTKNKTVPHVLEILSDYFLPHIGELNFTQKAYYLGYIVNKLLSVYTGIELPTDRDNFKYKRIELVGSLMYDLFREYYNIQQNTIRSDFEHKIFFNKAIYANNLHHLIQQNYKEIFNNRIVEKGFNKAFKGSWGSQPHTTKVGIVQDLNRLSHSSVLSHLRKTNLPLDASVKVVGPRVLHSTQWGFFDPIDTPDGGNIGLHKHMSISAYITQGYSRELLITWLREKVSLKLLEEAPISLISSSTKVIVNGYWVGIIDKPMECVDKIKLFRRNALLPIYTSVTFDNKDNTIFIYTDAGRICRPIFYKDQESNMMSCCNENVLKYIQDDKFTWNNLITGFNSKKISNFNPNSNKIYELNELYDNIEVESNPAKLQRFMKDKAIIDYIDTNETEGSLIAVNKKDLTKDEIKNFTHIEIHESLIFGMLGNMVNYPECNPATRDSFSCGQTKQASSMYHTNHQVRMDKTAVVLNSGQIPLVKSRYLKHINNEENSYGENTIVAVMCYTGYNVEDAILINEGALHRGLFRTTYYTTYELHEEISKSIDSTVENTFTDIQHDKRVINKIFGHDYSKLDKYGIIEENSEVNDETILIGMASSNSNNPDKKLDLSKKPKKGQLGIVDKTFITESEEGTRIAKVRLREERIPNLGDKMASRAGQKGTVGLVIPEKDMPFTKDGMRPDLIINPHAIPSRMTIGQFVETITGKACALHGAFGDCTAFNNDGSKIGVFGELLCKHGYHSSGNEVLYDGMSGEQLEVETFIGPNYYMRLKHMVKDKINYRARGKNTALTKQPVSGRANDGGLRIGEMERDVVISHGTTEFLRESMMERADKYQMAVCNTTGLTAIYNPNRNIFISPMADGPVNFTNTFDNNGMNIETITKFGRDFSIVNVPYSLKLLMQELQAINIQMRIITEDNIEQLENMSYSNNLNLLLQNNNIDIKRFMINMNNNYQVGNTEFKNLNEFEELNQKSPDSPPYAPFSPAYVPEQSPQYTPESPDYPPPGQKISPTSVTVNPSESPQLAPFSPAYVLEQSPQYNPNESPSIEQNEISDEKTHDFNLDDEVLFRGDSKSERKWKITNVGNRFITIQTNDMTGLNLNDKVKVVTPADIYRPGDFAYNSTNVEPLYTPPTSINNNESQIKIPQNNETPAINIKIVNGNDMSNDPNTTVITNNDNIDNNIDNDGISPSPIVMKPQEEDNNEINMPSNNDDFKNLVIKKI